MTATGYLVAGAGYVGARLLDALPADRRLGLKRQADDRPDTQAVDFDGDTPSLPRADVIIYTVPPPREGDDDPRLARFLAALPGTPQRMVYFSTSGVYGDTGGRRVAEDAALRPATSRARRRVAAETRLRDWCGEHGVTLCVLRVPGIYGPGRLGLDRLREGKSVLREADAGPANRIHVDDLVRCALAAARTGRPPTVCNVGDGDERSSTWFSRTVAELAGLPAPREISLAEAGREWSEMRLSFVRESRRLDLGRMRDELGVEPVYADAADGIRASLREDGVFAA